MKRVVLTGPVVKVLAAFASIAGLGLVLYVMSGMPPPRESDRVSSANGELSIIKPRDWNARPVYPPASAPQTVVIVTEPPKAVGIGPRLVASRLRMAPDIDELLKTGFQPGKFQEQNAVIFSDKVKRDFLWRAIFERNGRWYEVMLRLDAPIDVPSSSWWPYLMSFRAQRE